MIELASCFWINLLINDLIPWLTLIIVWHPACDVQVGWAIPIPAKAASRVQTTNMKILLSPKSELRNVTCSYPATIWHDSVACTLQQHDWMKISSLYNMQHANIKILSNIHHASLDLHIKWNGHTVINHMSLEMLASIKINLPIILFCFWPFSIG